MTEPSPAKASQTGSSISTIAAVVKELATGNLSALPALFEGMSEPKRSAFRKEYLQYFSLYSRTHSSETPVSEIPEAWLSMLPSRQRHFHGSILIDLAVGNRDEVLYAIVPAATRFPEFAGPMLRQRDLTKLIPAITKHLLANRSGALQAWSLLVDEGLAPMSWDDRTVMMICDSDSPSGFEFLRELVAKKPHWNELVYYMCGVENWLVISGRPALDLIDNLVQKNQLDRMRMLRCALAGLFLVKNQNQSKSCEMIFDFLAPTTEELAACQADLCSVMNHCKPVTLNFCFEKLEKLAADKRIDWPLVCPSVGAAFSRAGIAQANNAIRLLQSAIAPPTIPEGVCQALIQALLHSKREIAERAWKALQPGLPYANESVLYDLQQASQHAHGMLAKTIADYLTATTGGGNDASSSTSIATMTASSSDASWEELVDRLQSLPIAVRSALRCREACIAACLLELPESHDWRIQNAPVLQTSEQLPAIQSMDELVQRIGRMEHSSDDLFPEEPELILDGICRLPRSSDSQFQSKTAAIRKNALSSSPNGLSNKYAFPDYALVLLNWLGESIPPQLDRYIRREFDEVANFVVAATIDWVKEGRSFQLTSTPTHRGGWLDPRVWLDRLEAAQHSQAELLLEDIELALLRLAPDGRTTPIRDSSLVERARKLAGDHALVVRYAMGDSIAWEEMTGSKRLWVAAIKGRDPALAIPDHAAFVRDLSDPIVLQSACWKIVYSHDVGDVAHAKGCTVSLDNGDLRNWRPSKLEHVQLQTPFRTTREQVDNVFLTRFLMSRAASRHEWLHYRGHQPQQLDWYWNSVLKHLIVRSTKKVDVLHTDTNSPWLDSQRPLTHESASALWLATLTKGEVSKVWIQEVWAQLISEDRFNVPLLVHAATQIASYEWCALKRWAEILAPVAQRSTLHGWEVARLALNLICAIDIDQKDALGLIEVIQDAHTRLGIGLTSEERAVLAKYDSGKCKQAVAGIVAIVDELKPERAQAAREKLLIRIQRAQAWTDAIPEGRRVSIPLSESETAAEQVDMAVIEAHVAQASKRSESVATVSSAHSPDAIVPTVKATAAKSKKSVAKKKSQQTLEDAPLERSGKAIRLLRNGLPSLAAYSRFEYYIGWANENLVRASNRYDHEDRYLMFLFHHLGIPVVRSPWEIALHLQRDAHESMADKKSFLPMTWLVSLATSLVTDNVDGVKILLDGLDFNWDPGYSDVPVNALTLAMMATSSLRSTPANIPNSLKLQLDKDKKLSRLVEACDHIANRDSLAFAKSFESGAKKIANDIGKVLKSNEDWKVGWWPSALLCVLWHAAKHAGLDCSLINTSAMALVPTAATLGSANDSSELLAMPLPQNHNQLALQLFDQLMSQAGVRYALVRPRVNTKLIQPHTTDWTVVVDSSDEQAWNRLFDTHDPFSCLLNNDLQHDSPGDYMVPLVIIPHFGALFRRLAIPDSLRATILDIAERREYFGAEVSIAPLEESVGLLMPLLGALAGDPRLSIGKAQNRAYHRAELDETVKWIVGLLKTSNTEIIWPKIQAIANQLNAQAGVAHLKSFV